MTPRLAAVDQLIVDVITDSMSDTYASKPAFATSEMANILSAGAKEISGETLLVANLGYGLRLRTRIGKIEEIAITNGHWDHMGALPAALDAIAGCRGRQSVSVHVNPGMFNERGVLLANGTIFPAARVPTPAEMEAQGARVVNDGGERTLLDDYFYYSGGIPPCRRSRRAARTSSAARTIRRSGRPILS